MNIVAKRLWFFLTFDSILSFLSLYLSFLLRFNYEIPESFFASLFFYSGIICALKLCAFWAFGVYKIPWRFFSLDGLVQLTKAHLAAYAVFALFLLLFKADFMPDFPRSVAVIDAVVSMLILGMLRIAKRLFLTFERKKNVNALIIGADENGEYVYRNLRNLNILCFADGDRQKIGLRIHGKKVIALDDICAYADKHLIATAVIASTQNMPVKSLYELLSKSNIKDIRIVRLGESAQSAVVSEIKIEDLLARNPKDIDTNAVTQFIRGKRVMITGAGGSIGSEIARTVLRCEAAQLILIDSSEYNLYMIGEELSSPMVNLRLVSVTDQAAINAVFDEFAPDIVLHAAAYKHVPLVEKNPKAAVINNIFGTKTCIDAAIAHNCPAFVLISTDKAVRPTSIMGATKRVCELYLQNVEPKNTRLAAVRFGNVLGSSGSVIPHFRKLIEQGKSLTVTHPQMTRYFMLTSEAVMLVLQAASVAKGGEVFVLDMGESVNIAEMARKMLTLSGKEHLGITFTGLRAGEKLYEELLINEDDHASVYPSIFVGKPTKTSLKTLLKQIESLENASDIAAALKVIEPTFNHNKGV